MSGPPPSPRRRFPWQRFPRERFRIPPAVLVICRGQTLGFSWPSRFFVFFWVFFSPAQILSDSFPRKIQPSAFFKGFRDSFARQIKRAPASRLHSKLLCL